MDVPGPSQPASLDCLPDELLASLLGRLEVQDRQPLCLVCKRWERVLHSLELLRSLQIELKGEAALQSFGRWLARPAAGRIGTLHLHVKLASATDEEACTALFDLAAAVAACGDTGQVPQLHLHAEGPSGLLTVGSWAFQLGASLRSLVAESACTVVLAASLAGLPALQSLVLDAQLVRLPYWLRACLPPSLTRMSIDMHVEFLDGPEKEKRWLAEVASLTQLRQLDLGHVGCDPATYARLAHLSGCLTGLELRACAELPACLPQLSSLQKLSLNHTPLGDEKDEGWWGGRALNPALAALAASLTSLVIEEAPRADAFPAALTALQLLHHLAWHPQPPADPRLPAGSWLGRLQSLLLPSSAAAESRAELAAATQLQRLQVCAWHPVPRWHLDILAWAAQNGSLRELYLDCDRGELECGELAAAAARCSEQNPGLLVSTDAWL